MSCPPLRTVLLCLLLGGSGAQVYAQIKTDPSLGRAAQSLTGPKFLIPETLGKLAGNNLFHSFQTFNIGTGESATFTTTTPTIANIFSRVTGGSPSAINGALKLEAAAGKPNFFFINPAGVTFGAGASIDVPGAFHVTTADYIKFPEGKFYGDAAKASTFSSDAPEGFGFLGQGVGKVELQGATLNLPVAFHVAAGEIVIDQSTVIVDSGTLQLASAGKTVGQIPWATLPQSATSGTIRVAGSALDTSGDGAGNIRIAGGEVVIQGGSTLNADNSADASAPPGNGVAIRAKNLSISTGAKVTADALGSGNAGRVRIDVTGDMAVQNGGQVSSSTYGAGNSGEVDISVNGAMSILNGGGVGSASLGEGRAGIIKVNAGSLTIDGQASPKFTGIASNANHGSSGDAGEVVIKVSGVMSVVNGGAVTSVTFSQGKAGTIKVDAGRLHIDDQGGPNFTGIVSSAEPGSAGDAGELDLTVGGAMSVVNGGKVSSVTFGAGKAGIVKVNAGTLTIDAQESLLLTGITSSAMPESSSDAGEIVISVKGAMQVRKGGEVSSVSWTAGKAGTVKVNAATLVVDGTASDGYVSTIAASANQGSSGQTGSLIVNATERITISSGGELAIWNDATVANPALLTPTVLTVSAPRINLHDAAISADSPGNVAASNIVINARESLNLGAGSKITTAAKQGNGGSITIKGNGLVFLDKSQITTSVTGLSGNGGDITLNTKALAMNTGFIQANTVAANASGGDIAINVSTLLPSHNSLLVGGNTPYVFRSNAPGYNVIQAAAPDGVSGTLNVTSPTLDLSGSLSGLSGRMMNPASLGRNPCRAGGGSSLSLVGRGGLPPAVSGPFRIEATAPSLAPEAAAAGYVQKGMTGRLTHCSLS